MKRLLSQLGSLRVIRSWTAAVTTAVAAVAVVHRPLDSSDLCSRFIVLVAGSTQGTIRPSNATATALSVRHIRWCTTSRGLPRIPHTHQNTRRAISQPFFDHRGGRFDDCGSHRLRNVCAQLRIATACETFHVCKIVVLAILKANGFEL